MKSAVIAFAVALAVVRVRVWIGINVPPDTRAVSYILNHKRGKEAQ